VAVAGRMERRGRDARDVGGAGGAGGKVNRPSAWARDREHAFGLRS
jgi:hypothetical protein